MHLLTTKSKTMEKRTEYYHFLFAKEDNPVDSNGSGHVADSTTDISAIFELFEGEKHGVNIHRNLHVHFPIHLKY